jgi:hypothetical protein
MKKPIYAKLVLALVSIGFAMIANFVRTADRNGTALPERAKFAPGEYDVMNFTLDDGPVFGRDPRAARIEPVQKAVDASEATLPPEMVAVTWECVSLTTPSEQVNADAPERYTSSSNVTVGSPSGPTAIEGTEPIRSAPIAKLRSGPSRSRARHVRRGRSRIDLPERLAAPQAISCGTTTSTSSFRPTPPRCGSGGRASSSGPRKLR